MRRRCYALLLAVAITAAGLSLTGCSGNSSPAPAVNAPTGNVTLAAKFPTPDGAVKSLLPANTAAIEVYAVALPYSQSTTPTLLATLTPAAPSKAVNLAPGQYMITATAYDSTDPTTRKMLANTSTAGEVQANVANIINLTFLNGQWNLASPVVFSDGVTQLNDFVITGEGGYPAKAAFDFSKPLGGGFGMVKLRFNNNTSARTHGEMLTQFVGGTNSNAVFTESYNITQKCEDSYLAQTPCVMNSGDSIVMIQGLPAGATSLPQGSIDSYYQGELLYGDASQLLPSKGETQFSQPIFTNTAAATTNGKTISGNLVEFKLTATPTKTYKTGSTPAKMVAAAVKSAQSANTAYTNLTVTDYSYKVCATTATPNTGGWVFNGQPQTIGSATCYDSGYVQPTINPTTQQMTFNAGDFSYNLAPATTDLGDYCHIWDGSMYIYNQTGATLNPNYNTCTQQKPSTGDIYYPHRFIAKRTATKTAISYGSFKFSAWIEETNTGNAYVYPFTATGSTTVTPAK